MTSWNRSYRGTSQTQSSIINNNMIGISP